MKSVAPSRVRQRSAVLPRPAGVVCLPGLVALLDTLQAALGIGGGGVGAHHMLRGAHVGVGLDAVVAQAPEVLATTSAGAHDLTVLRKSAKRYRFTQKAGGFHCRTNERRRRRFRHEPR